jgi:hypothetical protein
MQGHQLYEYDSEVDALVTAVNSEAKRTVARPISNPNIVMESLAGTIQTTRFGIDWESAIYSSGPRSSDQPETESEVVQRVIRDFAWFCEVGKIALTDVVSMISDDFYSRGIECEVQCGMRILTEWLQLPHAIFITNADRSVCLHVTFNRSSYVFQAGGRSSAL